MLANILTFNFNWREIGQRGEQYAQGTFVTMKMRKLSEHSDSAAALLSAVANPKRLLILCNLVNGEVPVGVLANQVGLSQSALSQHLSKLRAQNLVRTRRDAQTIYYSSNSPQVLTLLSALETIYDDTAVNKSAA